MDASDKNMITKWYNQGMDLLNQDKNSEAVKCFRKSKKIKDKNKFLIQFL